LTDFDEIWHGDADWPPIGDTSLKFPFFQKKQDGGGRHLKTTQIAISQQGIDTLTDLREIWHDYAKWVS